jgi:hypothetical protein
MLLSIMAFIENNTTYAMKITDHSEPPCIDNKQLVVRKDLPECATKVAQSCLFKAPDDDLHVVELLDAALMRDNIPTVLWLLDTYKIHGNARYALHEGMPLQPLHLLDHGARIDSDERGAPYSDPIPAESKTHLFIFMRTFDDCKRALTHPYALGGANLRNHFMRMRHYIMALNKMDGEKLDRLYDEFMKQFEVPPQKEKRRKFHRSHPKFSDIVHDAFAYNKLIKQWWHDYTDHKKRLMSLVMSSMK